MSRPLEDVGPVILGIDAAWTAREPSGVALIGERDGRWHLISVAASYDQFTTNGAAPVARPQGSVAAPAALLDSCVTLCGKRPELVAIDMPLARSRITKRRESDNAVSRAYAARGAGTHTPSGERPGKISDELSQQFLEAGYPIQTERLKTPGLIETYPHPALIELTAQTKRLPYKAAKVSRYWPGVAAVDRRVKLYAEWRMIVESLEREIAGVRAALPELAPEARGFEVKAFEDKLDAIVCAWVGACALQGRAKPFGDDDSAIWIPLPR